MKNRTFLVNLIAFFAILMLTFPLINSTSADYIFSDNFQSGSLSPNWTQYTGSLTTNNQVTNNGEPYSVQSTVKITQPPGSPDPNANLYYHTLPSITNTMDFRAYVYVTSLAEPSTNQDYYQIWGFSGQTLVNGQLVWRPDYGDGELIVINVGGTLYWGLFYREATGSANPSGFSCQISPDNKTSDAVAVKANVWTCIELMQTVATSGQSNGEEKLYVNGMLVFDRTGVMNGDRTPYAATLGGSQAVTKTSDTWTYYVADVAVSSSYIGPNQNMLTTSTNYGTITPGNTSYAQGQQVTITATPPTATPGEQYLWQGWTGTGTGSYNGTGTQSGNSYTAQVTMNDNVNEKASWRLQYELTIDSSHGNAVGNSTWYNAGTSAYAAITPTVVPGTTGTQYVFASWSGDASGTASTSNAITMDGPKTAMANWQIQYQLTVSSAYGTTGGASWYNSGSSATATINSETVSGTAGTQYLFTGWSGDASGTTLTSNAIVMTGPKTATANWQTQYKLTIAQSGVASDYSSNFITVNGTSYGINGFSTWANTGDVYTFGYAATPLVAAPYSEQYLLTGVSGNSSAPSIIVSQPITITGAYKTQYYLTISSAYGTPSPTSGWFDNNTSISAYVPSPSSGYYCDGWTGTGSVPASTGQSALTFTITAPSSLTWTWGNAPSPTLTPSSTPAPTPVVTPVPTAKPTPTQTTSPTPSPKPTVTPTQSPKATSSQPISGYFTWNLSLYLIIVAVLVVIGAASVIILRKRKSKA